MRFLWDQYLHAWFAPRASESAPKLSPVEELVWQNTVSISLHSYWGRSNGSGFFVGNNLVLTAAHCVSRNAALGKIFAPYWDKHKKCYDVVHPYLRQRHGVEDMYVDHRYDLALLKLRGTPRHTLPPLKISRFSNINGGNRVIIPDIKARERGFDPYADIRRQKNVQASFIEGQAVGICITEDRESPALFEAHVVRGVSGSPIADKKSGRVISVVSQRGVRQSETEEAVRKFVIAKGPSPDDVRRFLKAAKVALCTNQGIAAKGPKAVLPHSRKPKQRLRSVPRQ